MKIGSFFIFLLATLVSITSGEANVSPCNNLFGNTIKVTTNIESWIPSDGRKIERKANGWVWLDSNGQWVTLSTKNGRPFIRWYYAGVLYSATPLEDNNLELTFDWNIHLLVKNLDEFESWLPKDTSNITTGPLGLEWNDDHGERVVLTTKNGQPFKYWRRAGILYTAAPFNWNVNIAPKQ